MVHLVRNSLKYVNYKQRAEVAKDLKTIYSAATEAEAEFQMELKALEMGQALSCHQPILADTLDTGYSALRVPRRDSEGDLHNKCD
jgi:transposase-like protein